MNQYFAERITLLRNERRLSQKQAAADIGISPAVLSHYEKGIRECKLELLVSIADYYEVSCDYLLGRTSIPSIQTAHAVQKHESGASGYDNQRRQCTAQKKTLMNTLHIIYDILARRRDQSLTNEIGGFLTVMLYTVFRTIYSSNPENPKGIFHISKEHVAAQAGSKMMLSLSHIRSRLKKNGSSVDGHIVLSPKLIYERYPAYAPSLFSLVERAETLCGTNDEQEE